MEKKTYIIGGQKYAPPFNVRDILNARIEITNPLPGEREKVIADLEHYIASSFIGKTLPGPGTRILHVRTLGPPGSGNTITIKEVFDSLPAKAKSYSMLSAYDENGAIYAISHYREALKKLKEKRKGLSESEYSEEEYFNDRLALRDRYRQASQIARDLLQAMIRDLGLDLYEDTTGSSPHTVPGYKQSREEEGRIGKTYISYARFRLRHERIANRDRNIHWKSEFIDKAIAVYEKIPDVIADAVQSGEELHLNYSTKKGRVNAVRIADGRLQHVDYTILQTIIEDLHEEMGEFTLLRDNDVINDDEYNRAMIAIKSMKHAIVQLPPRATPEPAPTVHPE